MIISQCFNINLPNTKEKKSKRQTLKMKYKIEKKCKDHRRKLKKEAKKLKALGIYKSSFYLIE